MSTEKEFHDISQSEDIAAIQNQSKKKMPWYAVLLAVVFCIAAFILLCYSVFTFIFVRTEVVGVSMQPTYNINLTIGTDYENSPYKDIVYVNRFNKGGHEDIVVIKQTATRNIIKRIVAVEGDKIDILKDPSDNLYYVYIQYAGQGEFIKQDEPYINSRLEMQFVYTEWQSYKLNNGIPSSSPLTVPEGHVFVMGDNRAHSEDSINLGPIKRSDIEGTVSFSLRYNQSFLEYWWKRIFG
ncbi:MAG: signal peptidase I [Christensenellaceae bacterium]|jgi:signal peptidase I|nr:signal peptidase I [Christensenellaceae bacterium]